ncbi:MAG: secondary thiamine-phosphate synthase enzyme YjbQ [Acidobacteriota bacterium]|nr:secondary thiamine-phosphate synthase enzyme YjbQ [Acidobacteriota bacterium]MDW3228797.1 secondary thiamine-phosphate synthase enzyme YjbQ [Acidobacteriota bacterium]
MKIISDSITISTHGHNDIRDLTSDVQEKLLSSGLNDGQVTVFVQGSTAAVTTIEYEPGLAKDLSELLEKLIPSSRSYYHDERWGDANGFSHLRAALLGPSLVVPFEKGKLKLGVWQQIVLIDFDNRSRNRNIALQFFGE